MRAAKLPESIDLPCGRATSPPAIVNARMRMKTNERTNSLADAGVFTGNVFGLELCMFVPLDTTTRPEKSKEFRLSGSGCFRYEARCYCTCQPGTFKPPQDIMTAV